MNRYVSCACVSLVLCAGAGRAAAPPVVAVRSISLAEAAKSGLEADGYRVERKADGSLGVSHPKRADSLEALRTANQKLLNVEVAYWNLYQSQKALSARERAVRDARELLRICESRHEAGTATRAEVVEAREQYRALRKQSGTVAEVALEMERQLVALTGLGAEVRLRPSDRPSLTRQRPDWDAALREAVANRPELRMSRNDVLFSKTIFFAERCVEAWLGVPCEDVWIVAGKVSGSPAKLCPFSRLSEIRHIGRAKAIEREGSMIHSIRPFVLPPIISHASFTLRLRLARDLEVLKDQEGKAQNFLELYYRRLHLNYKQVQSTRAQREAFGELLLSRKVQYAAGRCSLANLLEAQRFCADAQGAEYAAIGTYNNARAGFEFGKGATLDRHRMVFGQR